jgi:hypothetical protein
MFAKREIDLNQLGSNLDLNDINFWDSVSVE